MKLLKNCAADKKKIIGYIKNKSNPIEKYTQKWESLLENNNHYHAPNIVERSQVTILNVLCLAQTMCPNWQKSPYAPGSRPIKLVGTKSHSRIRQKIIKCFWKYETDTTGNILKFKKI